MSAWSKLQLIELPSNTADLNIIEHNSPLLRFEVWRVLKSGTKEELLEAIRQDGEIEKLYASLPKHLVEGVKGKGGNTKY